MSDIPVVQTEISNCHYCELRSQKQHVCVYHDGYRDGAEAVIREGGR